MKSPLTAAMAAATCAVITFTPTVAAAAPGPSAGGSRNLQMLVLSNRADLISGGDALVEAQLPPGADASRLRVLLATDDGLRNVSEAFARRANGRVLGLLERLPVGQSHLIAVLAGTPHGHDATRITITNHPNGGPVFSGPQVAPWICTTQANGLGPAQDPQCNAQPSHQFFYRRTSGEFARYDPAAPPADIATTTTDQGVTVPYVFREETGTQNRGIYRIAVLSDPVRPWTAWDAQNGWNHKLFYPFGANCNTYHTQGLAQNVQIDRALSRGFMVATSSLNVLGGNCNSIVSAESVMMLKEHITERYGEIRYTFAQGLSGGSIQQHEIANAYPGLLDGIQPNASYEDMWSGALVEVEDCHLMRRVFSTVSPNLWTDPAQRAAAQGNAVPVAPTDRTACEAWDSSFGNFQDPAYTQPPPGVPLPPFLQSCFPTPLTPEQQAQLYHPATNPAGCRSTYQDFLVAVFGQRPQRLWTPAERAAGFGFAKLPFDNVGVQYGLRALQAGTITPEQFVNLNENVGGVDIDHNFVPRRNVADPGAVQTAYRSSITQDAAQLDNVAIIDLRANNNLNDIHTAFHSHATRERLRNANGHANNQIIWTFPGPGLAPPASIADQAFLLMDRWLAAVEADRSNAPRSAKILRHKPAEAVDACFVDGVKVTDPNTCRATFPFAGDPRIAAGAPLSNDVLKCQLKPVNPRDYNVAFTAQQWTRLRQAFPRGVCDYRKPGADRVPSVPWLTYQDGPGGQPLGPAPASRP
ncbi:DUF6351 family protein [Micromonospora sp. CPCC 206061]|uniref:DUF6351 family protein n=1 Tax=Micromonospora sp. CPCC 206061 TaxID=3122410 RepID=UPI002FF19EA6